MTGTGSGEQSIQERLVPTMMCFGCGPANDRGLRLRSFPDGDLVVARFVPWLEHDNGLGFLNGGIIATLLDCHSAAAVLLTADELGITALPGASLPYVTSGIDVRYRRPAPLHSEVQLECEVQQATEAQMVVRARLSFDGKVRAEGEATWRRWHPRPTTSRH